MAQRTISPRVFYLLFLIVLCLFVPLQVRADKSLEYLPIVSCIAAMFLVAYLVARMGPRLLGFQYRKRSVERLMAAIEASDDGDGDGEPAIDLPLQVPCRRSIRIVMLSMGLVSLAMGLTYFWNPVSSTDDIVLFRVLLPIGAVGSCLIGILWIALIFRLRMICDITSDGITAPDAGGLAFKTFVPWNELVDCEFIYDDEDHPVDHFTLRDRSGRRRFLASRGWMILATPADRDRIFHVLRSRFPLQPKPEKSSESARLQPAPSGTWDRELDG
jgi:hypothetical protein